MIDFVYTAKDKESGEVRKGKISADNQNAAAALLIEKSMYPIKIEEASKAEGVWTKNAFGSGVKIKDRVLFTRQLSTLVKAGLPITQALNTAIDQVNNKGFQQTLQKVSANVEGGNTLANSFAQYPAIFNNVYISLIAAGEQSGTLDTALERLANQQEKEMQIIAKVRGALIYPIIVLVVIVGVLVYMLTTVLPQVAGLYKELGKSLPLLTQVLFGISQFITGYWYLVLLILAALIFGGRAYSHTPKGRQAFDKMKLHLPYFGGLYRKVYAARFSRTMGSLVNSGVPLLQALQISSEAVDNTIVAAIILKAREQVKTGKTLSSGLSNHPEIIKLVPQMIKIGEDSGTLGPMLDKVADYFENEVDQTVKNLSAVIEPVLILILGVAVILIVIAVLYPIYSLVFSVNLNNSNPGTGGLNNIK